MKKVNVYITGIIPQGICSDNKEDSTQLESYIIEDIMKCICEKKDLSEKHLPDFHTVNYVYNFNKIKNIHEVTLLYAYRYVIFSFKEKDMNILEDLYTLIKLGKKYTSSIFAFHSIIELENNLVL